MTDDENKTDAVKAAADKTAAALVDKAKDAKPDPKAKDEPAKLTLTEAELQARIDAAVKSRDEATAAEAKRLKDESDREAARAKGEWEKVAGDEKERANKLDAELATAKLAAKGRDVDLAVRDHLAEKHPEYVAVAKYVRPLVTYDASTSDEVIAKRVAEAAAQYVKDNPRAKSAPAGAPAAPANGLRRPYTEPVNRNGTPRITGAAAGF